jgi:cysteine desulfuration protein SufE
MFNGVNHKMDKAVVKLIEDFACFDGWQEKYSFIIELGRDLSSMDESLKVPEKIVEGCSSQVWLHCYMQNHKVFFTADSDAHIVKGLLSIVLLISSGKSKNEILNIDYQEIFSKLQLMNHLTPIRSNGLASVVKRIKTLASEI